MRLLQACALSPPPAARRVPGLQVSVTLRCVKKSLCPLRQPPITSNNAEYT